MTLEQVFARVEQNGQKKLEEDRKKEQQRAPPQDPN